MNTVERVEILNKHKWILAAALAAALCTLPACTRGPKDAVAADTASTVDGAALTDEGASETAQDAAAAVNLEMPELEMTQTLWADVAISPDWPRVSEHYVAAEYRFADGQFLLELVAAMPGYAETQEEAAESLLEQFAYRPGLVSLEHDLVDCGEVLQESSDTVRYLNPAMLYFDALYDIDSGEQRLRGVFLIYEDFATIEEEEEAYWFWRANSVSFLLDEEQYNETIEVIDAVLDSVAFSTMTIEDMQAFFETYNS